MQSESMVEGDMHVKGDDGNLKEINNCSKPLSSNLEVGHFIIVHKNES